jgi:hypothetical protein
MPVIPSEPMAPYLARVAAEAAEELRTRIQDPGDHPTPRSRQWEVISRIGQAIDELAASLRAIAPMAGDPAAERWLDNATWAIGGARMDIWLAWRQVAPRDERDRLRPDAAQPAPALAAADFPQQAGAIPLPGGRSQPPPARTSRTPGASRAPGTRKA